MLNILFIWLTSIMVIPTVHDYHVSRMEMQYNTGTQRIECRIHLFADDLEDALEARGLFDLGLATEMEVPQADSLVEVYLKEHIELVLNESIIELALVGKSRTEDYYGVWYYLETEAIPELSGELWVSNSVLMEMFSDQVNLLTSALKGDKPIYMLFRRENSRKSIAL